MRSLLSIVAGIAVMSGIVSANLWRELRTERQLTADLWTQLIEEKDARPPAPLAQPAPALTPPPVVTPARGEAAPEPATGVRIGSAMPPSAQNLLADPEYRNALLEQTRLGLRTSHPGLIAELGLSARDADELFTLLAENQPTFETSTDPAIRAERARRFNDSLLALLGNDRYVQFQDYQRTRGGRSAVTSFGSILTQANQPLTAAQTRTLISAMAAMEAEPEHQQWVNDQLAARKLSLNNPQDQARILEELQSRQEESNRRMLEAMAPHLAPQQLAIMRAQFEAQIAVGRASARVQRERDRATQGLQ